MPVATAIAASSAMISAEESENTDWAIIIEECKTLNTKKEIYTCLQQVQLDKQKCDHDGNIGLGTICLIAIFMIIVSIYFDW